MMRFLIAFILSSFLIFAQQTRFIIFGDTQFQNPQIFANYIKDAKSYNPDFYVHVGDMIHGHTHSKDIIKTEWQIFQKEIAPIKNKFYPTPGNHDLTTIEALDIYKQIWKNKLYYSFDIKNVHFIILNTFTNVDSFYILDHQQQLWLQNDLESNINKIIFVSLHPPLYLSNWNYWEKFHNLFVKYNVKAVFTGHNHVYNHKIIDNINYFCINTSGNITYNNNFYTGYFWGYLIVDVINKDSIIYKIKTDNKLFTTTDFSEKLATKLKSILFTNTSIMIDTPITNKQITFTLENKSDQEITYNLEWIIKDKNIQIEPKTSSFTIQPLSSKEVIFTVKASKKLKTNNLARLDIKFFYDDKDNNRQIPLYYYVDLIVNKIAHSKFTNTGPNLDGIPDEPIWQNIKPIILTQKNIKTKIYILHDSTYFYFAFWNDEPKPEKLTAKAYGSLPLVFGDDDIEFHFFPDGNPNKFYRIMINPNNTQFISGPEGRFTFPVISKTYAGKNFWSGELKIKISDLKLDKLKNLRFNIRRNRTQSYPNNTIEWQETNKYPPYQLHKFGRLIFD